MLEVTLGVPGNLQRFSASNASRKVRVSDLFDPWFELLIESSRFNTVNSAVDREEPVLEGLRALPFFGKARRLRLAVGCRKAANLHADRKEDGPVDPDAVWELLKFNRPPAI